MTPRGRFTLEWWGRIRAAETYQFVPRLNGLGPSCMSLVETAVEAMCTGLDRPRTCSVAEAVWACTFRPRCVWSRTVALLHAKCPRVRQGRRANPNPIRRTSTESTHLSKGTWRPVHARVSEEKRNPFLLLPKMLPSVERAPLLDQPLSS